MNREKVIFAFFIVLALTLNFGFYLGDITDISQHNVYVLFAALVVSLICTVLKFGDRTHFGALMLATSLVVDLQLIIAAVMWGYAVNIGDGMTVEMTTSVISLCGGALLANLISVVLLVVETIVIRR